MANNIKVPGNKNREAKSILYPELHHVRPGLPCLSCVSGPLAMAGKAGTNIAMESPCLSPGRLDRTLSHGD